MLRNLKVTNGNICVDASGPDGSKGTLIIEIPNQPISVQEVILTVNDKTACIPAPETGKLCTVKVSLHIDGLGSAELKQLLQMPKLKT